MIDQLRKQPLLGLALLLLFTPAAHASRVTVGTYRTGTPSTEAFSGVLRALAQEGFVIKSTDKSQGTVQADRMAWGTGTAAFSVFVTVGKEGDATSIEPTFTKNPGIVGSSSDKWANAFGRELKVAFPDITVNLVKR